MSKWYEFTQNNTGGSFDVDDEICHRLFIEADSESEAEEKAFGMGVYYAAALMAAIARAVATAGVRLMR